MSDKIMRLEREVEMAGRLAPLADPAVEAWFRLNDRALVARVLAATSDDERREAAAEANAFRSLENFIKTAIARGPRAASDLDTLRG